MTPRRELYEAEEKTLRVMLAEEEEEKEKERREIERKKQGKTSPRMLATIPETLRPAHFRESQFPLYLNNGEDLSHQTSQSFFFLLPLKHVKR